MKKYLDLGQKLTLADLLKIVSLIFFAGAFYATNLAEHKSFIKEDSRHEEVLARLDKNIEVLKATVVKLDTIICINTKGSAWLLSTNNL